MFNCCCCYNYWLSVIIKINANNYLDEFKSSTSNWYHRPVFCELNCNYHKPWLLGFIELSFSSYSNEHLKVLLITAIKVNYLILNKGKQFLLLFTSTAISHLRSPFNVQKFTWSKSKWLRLFFAFHSKHGQVHKLLSNDNVLGLLISSTVYLNQFLVIYFVTIWFFRKAHSFEIWPL